MEIDKIDGYGQLLDIHPKLCGGHLYLLNKRISIGGLAMNERRWTFVDLIVLDLYWTSTQKFLEDIFVITSYHKYLGD